VSTLKRATLVSTEPASQLECKVRDMSKTGARLAVAPSAKIPDEFILLVAEHKHLCRVAWRSAKEVGVRFVLGSVGDLA
jgi:two-component system cell cycle response regulator